MELQAVSDEDLEEVAVIIACCIEANCFGCEYLCHACCVCVAEAVVDADVAEEDDLLDEEAFCVGVGVVVVVVACVEEGDV